MARRKKPPSLNQLGSVQLLQKWNVHLMRSVAVQRLSGMSPREAGQPRQGRPAPHSEVWALIFWQMLSHQA